MVKYILRWSSFIETPYHLWCFDKTSEAWWMHSILSKEGSRFLSKMLACVFSDTFPYWKNI
jgi:hypothetical protein